MRMRMRRKNRGRSGSGEGKKRNRLSDENERSEWVNVTTTVTHSGYCDTTVTRAQMQLTREIQQL